MNVGKSYILYPPITVYLAALNLKPPKERSWLCARSEHARLSSNAAAVLTRHSLSMWRRFLWHCEYGLPGDHRSYYVSTVKEGWYPTSICTCVSTFVHEKGRNILVSARSQNTSYTQR